MSGAGTHQRGRSAEAFTETAPARADTVRLAARRESTLHGGWRSVRVSQRDATAAAAAVGEQPGQSCVETDWKRGPAAGACT